jgi:hypothetical protein
MIRSEMRIADCAPNCALACGQSFCGVAQSHSGIALLGLTAVEAGFYLFECHQAFGDYAVDDG